MTGELWAKQQKLGTEIINYAHAFMIEALQRLGEMLKAGQNAGQVAKAGDRRKYSDKEYLDDLGLDAKTSHIAQRLAKLRDKALALEYYARQAQNVEAERKAIEVRVRAERRAGELLAGARRAHGPGRGKKNVHAEQSFSEAKRDAKISDTQAH